MATSWGIDDPDMEAFVDANLVSFAAWDLVIYLNRNPRACETQEAFANILARQTGDLEPVLSVLVGNAVLARGKRRTDGAVCYRVQDDPEVRRIMARFVELAARRDHRLEFVRRVLAHMTPE